MLAERVPGLLPDLDVHDALEVSAVHSLAGFNLADQLITRPPYSDPHHSASVASIVGGGQRMAKPGAISCAHKGVLFLDDSTEAQSIRGDAGSCRLAAIGGSLVGPRAGMTFWQTLTDGRIASGMCPSSSATRRQPSVPRSYSARTPTRSPTGTRRWRNRMPTVEPAQLGGQPSQFR